MLREVRPRHAWACVPIGHPELSVGVNGALSRPGEEGFPERAGLGVGERRVCVWCPRTHPEDHAGRMEDFLEELLQHRAPEALQQCLRKVRAQGRVLTRGDRPACGPLLRVPRCSHRRSGVLRGHAVLQPTVLSISLLPLHLPRP